MPFSFDLNDGRGIPFFRSDRLAAFPPSPLRLFVFPIFPPFRGGLRPAAFGYPGQRRLKTASKLNDRFIYPVSSFPAAYCSPLTAHSFEFESKKRSVCFPQACYFVFRREIIRRDQSYATQ
jgi:hypothetical protein